MEKTPKTKYRLEKDKPTKDASVTTRRERVKGEKEPEFDELDVDGTRGRPMNLGS